MLQLGDSLNLIGYGNKTMPEHKYVIGTLLRGSPPDAPRYRYVQLTTTAYTDDLSKARRFDTLEAARCAAYEWETVIKVEK